MSKLISVDSGSSFLKYFDGTEAKQFPALIERIADDAPPYPDEILIAGERYAVGDTALLARNRYVEDPHIQRGFHGSHEQTVQMCYAFQLLGLDGEYDQLIASLPYADHQRDEVRRSVIQRRSFEWQTGTGTKRRVAFRNVATTPQGVGALLYHRRQTPGLYRLATLIDVGSCTLDVVTIGYDERIDDYQFNHQACGSNRKISVSKFKNAWLSLIRDIDGLQNRNFGYHQLMNLPIRGELKLPHRGDAVDLAPSFARVRHEFTQEVAQTVRDITGDLWDSLDAIILTGGGARLIDLKTWPDNRTVLLDVYANVKGQFYAAQSASEKGMDEVA